VIPDPPLLIVTDRQQARAPLGDILEAVFAAGCRWASVREKDLSADEQVRLARNLLPVARRWNARLTLHGEPRIAASVGVDGVHLRAASDPAAARARLPPRALVGISIHGVAEARALDPDLVDYAIAGPAFESASKRGYGPALGAGGIRDIAAAARVPVIAIGGITSSGVRDLIGAGAAGVAVMGAVMRSRDPASEVRALLAALAQPRARYGDTP
jgi:thiamine-phosphate pyrophosphorylase